MNTVLEFLSNLFYAGSLGYSALNTARSALSSVVILTDTNYSISSHPFIARFMKGVYNLKPPKPRYKQIWDVRIVLQFLRKLSPAKTLSLKALTLKVCMLIAIVSGRRVQTLHKLRINAMSIKAKSFLFHVDQLLKQSRPGNTGCVLQLDAYPTEKSLCIYTYLTRYLLCTKDIRGAEQSLFVSYQRPHKAVSKDIIARWLRCVMHLAGVNTEVYKAHSTRAAVASAANYSCIPVDQIMQSIGWSSERTFSQYYNKPIDGGSHFVNALLRKR